MILNNNCSGSRRRNLFLEVLDKKTRTHPRVIGDVRYTAWIKKHGRGRVFYVGPSHQPESYKTAAMLRFYLDGIQYALGELACDDSPKKEKK